MRAKGSAAACTAHCCVLPRVAAETCCDERSGRFGEERPPLGVAAARSLDQGLSRRGGLHATVLCRVVRLASYMAASARAIRWSSVVSSARLAVTPIETPNEIDPPAVGNSHVPTRAWMRLAAA